MEARSLDGALKLIMEQRGCSGNQLARDLGVSQSWLSYASRGKKDTSTGKAIRLLARVGWELVIRPKREEEDSVKRREFVTAAASVMFVPSPKVAPHEDPAYLRELARRTALNRHEHGGTATAASAIRHVRRIESVITGKDKKLQEAASELAVEAVWTLNDAELFDAGENVGRLAVELARCSEKADAQSRAYSALAALNEGRGDADRAIAYAQAGAKLHDVSEAQQAWMALRLGRSLALVRGQQHASRDVVESVRGPLVDARGFPDQSAFDLADMTGGIGRAFYGLGVYGDAQACLDEAVGILGQSSPNPQSKFLAHQIVAALRTSQLSLAADRMLALVRLVPLVNSRRLDRYLKEVLAASAPWRTVPEIRIAREQLWAVASLNASM